VKRPVRTIDGIDHLFCRACSAWHPVAAFHRRSGSGRPDSHCKTCRAAQIRAYDLAHREERLAYWRHGKLRRCTASRVYGRRGRREQRTYRVLFPFCGIGPGAMGFALA
jgi:hypothetical protein